MDGFFTDSPATGARVASQYTAAEVRSAQHLAFALETSSAAANMGGSGGFEGVTLGPDGKTPYALLVANGNNSPGTGGHGVDVKDTNEFIWLKPDAPLTLAPGAGRR